jgi:hypothetical protein
MTLIDAAFSVMFPISVMAVLSNLGYEGADPSVALIFFVVTLGVWLGSIWFFNRCIKLGKYTVLDVVKINLAMRIILAPIYVVIFVLCFFAMMLGPWGVAFWALAFFIDCSLLIATNLSVIPCFKIFSKCKIFDTALVVISFLGQFIFCIDVVIAVVYLVRLNSMRKRANYGR